MTTEERLPDWSSLLELRSTSGRRSASGSPRSSITSGSQRSRGESNSRVMMTCGMPGAAVISCDAAACPCPVLSSSPACNVASNSSSRS